MVNIFKQHTLTFVPKNYQKTDLPDGLHYVDPNGNRWEVFEGVFTNA